MSLCLIVVFRVVIMLSLPLFFIGSLYSWMWMFQIYRSARRARSSGLSAEYLIGTTLGRAFFALCEPSIISIRVVVGCGGVVADAHLDFLACPKNIFDVEPRSACHGVLHSSQV